MGAQQSSGRRGDVRLRRRAATAGLTSDELRGVSAEEALHIENLKIKNHSPAEIAELQAELLARRRAAAASGAGAGGAGSGSQGAASTPPTQPRKGGAASSKAPASEVDLPPWEIVASLGEQEWFAFRSWLEAGWRCRKCGHVRDDHAEHPKTIRLLAECGVPIPNVRGASGAGAASGRRDSGDMNSPGNSSPGGPMVVGYASESPDAHIRYLSDSTRSGPSSSGGSPLNPAAGGAPGGKSLRRVPSKDDSPRFNEGVNSPFRDGDDGAGEGISGTLPKLADGTQSAGTSAREQGRLPLSMGVESVVSGVVVPAGYNYAVKEKVLHAITRAHQVYFLDKEPNGTHVFDFLLNSLLDCTSSPVGFIASALLKADGTPYLRTHAMTNVAWNKEIKAWYAANAHKGLVFTNLDSLHGSIVLTGEPVITNDALSDPRSKGTPPGHPVISKFFGIPLYTAGELIGIYGVANSPQGYDEQLQKDLEPLTMTIAQLMYAVNERKRRKEAELHLTSVVQVAKEGIISMSASGHVTTVNVAAREMFGMLQKKEKYTHEEMHAPIPPTLKLEDLVTEIDGRSNYLQQGLERQTSEHVHRGKGKRADGSSFPIEISISKGTYDTVFYVAVIRDMSHEEEIEHQLHDVQEHWEDQVTGLEDGLWDWNLADNTFFFSEHWFTNIGYQLGEMPSNLDTWDSLIHPGDRERAFNLLKDHLDGRSDTYHDEHRLRCKDGTYKWFRHRGKVVRHKTPDGSGESAHFVSSHEDIAEDHKLHDAADVAREATNQLLRQEAENMARAALDMRESAVTIAQAAHALEKTNLTADQRPHVAAIAERGDWLKAHAEEHMLSAADVEAGAVVLDIFAFPVEEMAETAVVTMGERAQAKGLEMVMEMEVDTPVFMISDEKVVLQVIMDLLSAAVHATPAGFVRLSLSSEMMEPVGLSDPHGAEKHLAITVDGSGNAEASEGIEDSFMIESAQKLLPLVGGVLTTVIDPKRGAIHTAHIPVNTGHQLYNAAAQMCGDACLKPLGVQQPLQAARVLIVGPVQVTVAAVAKELKAWKVPHATICSTPEMAFTYLFPEGKLPRVALSVGTEIPRTFRDGSPREGLARMYDVVIVDFSHRQGGSILNDPALKEVAQALGKDSVGVIVVTKAQTIAQRRAGRRGKVVEEIETMELFRSAPGNHWTKKRRPLMLREPVVRPHILLEALEAAYRMVPGNEEVVERTKREQLELFLLHKPKPTNMAGMGFTTGVGSPGSVASSTASTRPLTSRILLAEHSPVDMRVAQLRLTSRGATVEIAASAAEMVKRLNASLEPFDLVVLDAHLKDLGDPRVGLRTIRSSRAGANARIIVTKQGRNPSEVEQLEAAGATGCLARPFTTADLEDACAGALLEPPPTS